MMISDQISGLIQAVEQADSAEGLLEAVEDLAAVGHEAAIPSLIEVLGYNNPGAAVAAVEGLIELGDVAVPLLLEQIDGYNYGARAWATRALAGIGNPRALNLLLYAASSDFSLSVRRAAARGLGNISWSKLPDGEITEAQAQTLNTLMEVLQDSEWVVRYAAVVGLERLAFSVRDTKPAYFFQIQETLNCLIGTEPELTVCSRAKLACTKLL